CRLRPRLLHRSAVAVLRPGGRGLAPAPDLAAPHRHRHERGRAGHRGARRALHDRLRPLPRRLDPGDPGGLHLHHRGLAAGPRGPDVGPGAGRRPPGRGGRHRRARRSPAAGGRRDGVDYTVEHAGDRLLIVHNDGHRGFALAQATLAEPGCWEELLVAGEGERLLAVEAFAGFVALELRSGGLASVRLLPRAADGTVLVDRAADVTHGGELDTVEIDANPNWDQTTLRYQLTSMLTPPTIAERE